MKISLNAFLVAALFFHCCSSAPRYGTQLPPSRIMKKPKANRLSEETKKLILRLFKEGLRQKDICEKLSLGKSTVNYIVRPKTREKTKERQQKRRTVFVKKIDTFFIQFISFILYPNNL